MDIELLLVGVELDMVVVDLLLDTQILGVCDSEVHISLFLLDFIIYNQRYLGRDDS